MMQQSVISKVNNWILAVCCMEWMCSCVVDLSLSICFTSSCVWLPPFCGHVVVVDNISTIVTPCLEF